MPATRHTPNSENCPNWQAALGVCYITAMTKLSLPLLLAVVLISCSVDDATPETDVVADSAEQAVEESASDESENAIEEPKETDLDEADVGSDQSEGGETTSNESEDEADAPGLSRDNPVPVGGYLDITLDTFGDADGSVWRVQVTGVGSDITEATLEENMFNEPPESGHAFYGVPFKITLIDAGKEPLAPWFNLSWESFGPASLKIFTEYDNDCGIIPNEFDDSVELFIGGSIEGNLCWSLPQDDIASGPLVSLEPDGSRVFLATTGEVVTAPADSAPVESGANDGEGALGSRSNPVPVGESFTVTLDTFGDADGSSWGVIVTGAGSDITAQVLSENMFNEEPQDGSIFFGVPFKITLLEAGKEPLAPWLNLSWDSFGPISKKIFSEFDADCGIVPGALEEMTELFVGGSLEGTLCWAMPIEDAEEGPLVSLEPDGTRVYLATR